MTVSLQGFDPALVNLIQQNVLARAFQEVLFPKLMFRAEAAPERWEANLGDVKIFTRAGTMPVSTKPLPPAQDPVPKTYGTEQFRAEAMPYGDRLQTHMPSSRVAIASKFVLDGQKLAENAGLTINRLVRNKLFSAYLSGDTVTIAGYSTGASQIKVANCNGFLERVLNGSLVPVSPAAPISIQIGTTNIANTVIAAVPDVPGEVQGSGTLTLGTPLGANLSTRSRILALHRARILRAGNAGTIDGITSSSTLSVASIINAVQLLRGQNVPPHPDGTYHVHLSADGVTQIFLDPLWLSLNANSSALPQGAASGVFGDLIVGRGFGCTFMSNNETPNTFNVETIYASGANALVSPQIGAELVNETAVPIARTIITGGGAIYEMWIPENEYETEAGNLGVVKTFQATNGGVIINTDRIRYIIRKPLDVMQRIVDQAWSFSGDWVLPSDILSGNGAKFKRAVILEHAGS